MGLNCCGRFLICCELQLHCRFSDGHARRLVVTTVNTQLAVVTEYIVQMCKYMAMRQYRRLFLMEFRELINPLIKQINVLETNQHIN